MTITDLEQLRRDLSVGEVASRSGVAVSTIHFYESKGLITSKRNAGNQRRYARDVLRRVAVIKVAHGSAFRSHRSPQRSIHCRKVEHRQQRIGPSCRRPGSRN